MITPTNITVIMAAARLVLAAVDLLEVRLAAARGSVGP